MDTMLGMDVINADRNRPRHGFIFALFIFLLLGCWASLAAQPTALQKESEQLGLAFAGERLGEVYKRFDPALKESYSLGKLQDVRANLATHGGKLLNVQAARGGPTPRGTQLFVVPMDFETLSIDMLLTWAVDGNSASLVGFAVRPRGKVLKPEVARPDSIPFGDAAYVDRERFREVTVEIGADTDPIKAKLATPLWKTGDRYFPGVVFILDSEMADEDGSAGVNRPARDIALGLAGMGVASLRFAFRRDQQPDLTGQAYTVHQDILNDALEATRTLARTDGIDKERIYVIGFGNGAWLAPELARTLPAIAGLVLIAPPANFNAPTHMDRLRSDGAIGPDVDNREWVLSQGSLEFLAAGTLDNTHIVAQRPASYWYSVGRLRPAEFLRDYKKPVLIVFGGQDVLLGETEKTTWGGLTDERRNVVLDYYADLNRWLMPSQADGGPEESRHPGHVELEVIDRIAALVKPKAR